jgi:16S rRNA (uracil1498-N3)-methyltransferase
MHRFFLSDQQFVLAPGLSFALPDPLAHQVRDVLHLKIDEAFTLFDARGEEYRATLVSSSRAAVVVTVGDRIYTNREPKTHIILCQGMLKSARFEFILEKGTELGVSTFVPMFCQRSTSGLEEVGSAKMQRWQRILQEATEQCGRTRVPTLSPVRTLAQVLKDRPQDALALMPWEEEHALTLRAVLSASVEATNAPRTVMLFIGPEGGLTAEEASQAQSDGVQVVSLGPRILRAETAALATVADVIYALEL